MIAVSGIALNYKNLRIRKWQFSLTDKEVSPEALDDYVGLQKVFGIIIHCETLEIIDTDLIARLFFDRRGITETLALYAAKEQENKSFHPKILIKSDVSETLLFDVGEIISCIDEGLLPTVIEVAHKHNIYLEDDFRL